MNWWFTQQQTTLELTWKLWYKNALPTSFLHERVTGKWVSKCGSTRRGDPRNFQKNCEWWFSAISTSSLLVASQGSYVKISWTDTLGSGILSKNIFINLTMMNLTQLFSSRLCWIVFRICQNFTMNGLMHFIQVLKNIQIPQNQLVK